MQQIERYGIIALLFFVVSIVVVALWDPEPGTSLSEINTRMAAGEKRAPRELPLAQPGNFNKAKAWTEQESRQAQGNRKRPAATHSPSAPLDLGAQAKGRYRGRNAGVATKPKAELQGLPMASPAKLVNPGPSRLKREQTRPNAGSVRSTGRLTQAQRPTKKASGGGDMLRGSTQRAAKPRAIPASFSKASQGRNKPLASGLKYTVKAGDSLERIARKQLGNGNQWKQLAALNGITNPDMVRIGDVLELPTAAAKSQSKTSASGAKRKGVKSTTGASGPTYTVAKGDVLSRIAERHLGSSKRWREIVALNPGLDPARLMVGKKLVMPGGTKPAKVAVPSEATYLAKAGTSRAKSARFVVE